MYNNAWMEKMKNKVCFYLTENEGKTVNSDLCKTFSLKPSTVRAIVNYARSQGEPICSDREGYFYSTDPTHIRATIEHLESRIAKQQEAVDGMKRLLVQEDKTHENVSE